MGNYVRGTLMKDEYVLYEAKISLWSQLPLIVFGLFWLLWMTATMAADASSEVNQVESVIFLIFGLLPLVIVLLRYTTTEFAITNKRVIAKFGVFSRHSIEMKLPRVESIQVNQGILGRIFNYGSLIVSGAGNPLAPVPGISNPLEFRRIALEAQDQVGAVKAHPNQSIGSAKLVAVLVLFVVCSVAVVFVLNHNHHVATRVASSGESSLDTPAKESQTNSDGRTSPQITPTKPIASTVEGVDKFSSSQENSGFRTYMNERFGFSIDYPESFVAQEPPENGDGIKIEAKDGSAVLVASGSNISGIDMPTYYNSAIQSVKGQLGYHTASHNWFVITWKEGERLTYQKTFVGSGSENSFTFTFPENQKADYDDAITKMEKSFRHGDLSHAR